MEVALQVRYATAFPLDHFSNLLPILVTVLMFLASAVPRCFYRNGLRTMYLLLCTLITRAGSLICAICGCPDIVAWGEGAGRRKADVEVAV